MTTPLPDPLDLSDVSANGIFTATADEVNAIAETADQTGFTVCHAALQDCADKQDLLARLATALAFPDWFGHNWDALADSLTDLAWLPSGTGYVFVLEGMDTATEHSATLLEILGDAIAFWQQQDTPMWVLLTPMEGAA